MGKLPEDIRFSSMYSVASSMALAHPESFERFAMENLRQSFADFVANKKAQKFEEEFATTYRLELYVATPNEFWEIVEQEAHKLASHWDRHVRQPTSEGEPK